MKIVTRLYLLPVLVALLASVHLTMGITSSSARRTYRLAEQRNIFGESINKFRQAKAFGLLQMSAEDTSVYDFDMLSSDIQDQITLTQERLGIPTDTTSSSSSSSTSTTTTSSTSSTSSNATSSASGNGTSTSELSSTDLREIVANAVAGDILEGISEYVQNIAIACDSAYVHDLAIAAVCSLCGASEAFLLNAQNWFKIGFVYGRSTQFSDLLNQISLYVPGANFTAAFSSMESGFICLASDMITGNMSISDLLQDMNFSSFEIPATDLFNAGADITPTFFETVYYAGSDLESSYFERFNLRYAMDYDVKTSDGVLHFEEADFSSVNNYLLFTGEASYTESGIVRNFTLNYNLQDYNAQTLATTVDLRDDPIRLSTAITEFVDDNLTLTDLIDVKLVQIVFGSLESYFVSEMKYQIVAGKKNTTVARVRFDFSIIPDFSITPEFDVKNATGHFVAIPQAGSSNGAFTGLLHIDGTTWKAANTSSLDSLLIEASDDSSTSLYNMNFTLLQTADNFTILLVPSTNFTLAQVEEIFLNVSEQVKSYDGSFFPNDTKYNLFDLSVYTISEPLIEIVSFPKPAYLIMGQLTGTSHEGFIKLLTTDIGGYQNTFLFMEFYDNEALELLEEVLPQEANNLKKVEKVVSQRILTISIASRDIDLNAYPDLNSSSPSNSLEWEAGTTIGYIFKLDSHTSHNCSDSTFCSFLTLNYGSDTEYSLSGPIGDDGFDLAGALPTSPIGDLAISVESAELHLGLSNSSSNALQVYILFEGSINLPPNSTINLDGTINLAGDEAYLAATTTDSWTYVAGIKTIEIDRLVLTAEISVKNGSVIQPVADSIIIFGNDCFSDTNVFQSENCTYGEASVHFTFEESSSNNVSLIEGYLQNLTNDQVLYDLAGFNETFVADNVTRVINLVQYSGLILYNITTLPKDFDNEVKAQQSEAQTTENEEASEEETLEYSEEETAVESSTEGEETVASVEDASGVSAFISLAYHKVDSLYLEFKNYYDNGKTEKGRKIQVAKVKRSFAMESAFGSEESTESSSEEEENTEADEDASSGKASLEHMGISVLALATLADISGISTIDIDAVDGILYEIFTFDTAELAHGNIAIEGSNPALNTITIRISDQIPAQEQVSFQASNISLLGYSLNNSTVELNNNGISINGTLNVNSSLIISAGTTAALSDSFNSSDFNLTMSVNESSIDTIEQLVMNQIDSWLPDLISRFSNYDALLTSYSSQLAALLENLCSAGQCSLATECTTAPYETCSKYATKKSCVDTESYCSDVSVTCNSTATECILEQEYCSPNSTSSNGVTCNTSCTDYADICQKYEYNCIGSTSDICVEYETVNDTSNCLTTGISCDAEWVVNSDCLAACNASLVRYSTYDDAFSQFSSALQTAQEDMKGVNTFNESFSANSTEFTIESWEVDDTLKEKLDSESLKWQLKFKVTSGETTIEKSVQVTGIDLNDQDDIVQEIYEEVLTVIGDKYSFNGTLVSDTDSFFANLEAAIATLENL